MVCPRIEKCPLFATFKVKASPGIWAAYYCESKFETCARLKLFESGQSVPVNLLPDGTFLTGGSIRS